MLPILADVAVEFLEMWGLGDGGHLCIIGAWVRELECPDVALKILKLV